MKTICLSPTGFVSGDPSLQINYPFVLHPSTVVTCTAPGDLKWISMGLTLPANVSIKEVVICYQVSNSRSFISQVRLVEMDAPDKALVIHDDVTELKSITPVCHTSSVGGAVASPGTAMTLALRLTFTDPGDQIMLGAVAVNIETEPICVPSFPKAKLPAPGTPGCLAHVTDGVRGLWMDQGTRWFPINGGVVNTEEFDGADLGERFNKAVAALLPGGGTIVIPPGEYPPTATELFVRVGQAPIAVFAYGAVIKTKGAISGIRVTSIPPGPRTADNEFPGGCSIYGLKIDHRDPLKSDALYGFNIEGGWNVRLYDPTVIAWRVSDTYAGIRVGSLDPYDIDASSLWTSIINPWVNSPDSGTPISYGIILEAGSNATTIRGGGIRCARTGLAIRNQKGTCPPGTVKPPEEKNPLDRIPNAVIVDGVAFEGYETAIHVRGLKDSNIAGLRIVNNRFEHGKYALSITGIKKLPSGPPYLAGNMFVHSALNNNKHDEKKPLSEFYLDNPGKLPVNTWDFLNHPDIGVPKLFRGIQITPQGGAEYPLDIIAPGGNRGIHIRSGEPGSSQAVLITYTADPPDGHKGRISSQHEHELALSNIQGVSATNSNAHNLRSSVTFAGSSTAIVSFSTAEPDDEYFVTVTGNSDENFWVTNKMKGGFTIHSSNLTSVAEVDWIMIR